MNFTITTKRNIFYIVFLVGLIFIASLPAFRTGIYKGHDLPFHLGRIQAIAEMLQEGQFPVRYEANAWYGHGYISTTMYGNIFLYLPALLYMVGLPLWRAYNIYIICVNIATVFVGYYSFKEIFSSRRYGLISIYIYTLAGYRLSNVYMRAAVGEYTAMIFIPLVLLGMYRLYVKREKSFVARNIPLIVGMTGLIQSHILTTEIICLILLIFALSNFKSTVLNVKDICFSVIVTLGLNLFFIVPFLDSYSSMDLYINSELTLNSIRGDGLYLSQILGLFTEGSGGSYLWTTEDEGYLNLGIVIILCMLVSVVGAIAAKKQKQVKYIWQIIVIGLVAVWLSTVYFPWDLFTGEGIIAKLMSSVQYPWRYMLIQTVCFTIAGVYGLKSIIKFIPANTIRAYNIRFLAIFICVASIAVAATGVFDYTLSDRNATLYNAVADVDWADKLYLPVGTDRTLLVDTTNKVDGDEITLPILAYDNLYVVDKDGNTINWSVGENNCISVNYTGNPDDLSVIFKEPLVWRISEIISLMTIVLLFVYCHIKTC